MTATTADVKRHPIRGALWGFLLGIGLAFILIDRAVIAFGTSKVYIVILIGILLGILWGAFAPAKSAKQPETQVKAEVKSSDSPSASAGIETSDPDSSDGDSGEAQPNNS